MTSFHGGLAFAGLALFTVAPAQGADSYDACTGVIASVPTTLTTQGIWCLDHDLATAVTSGAAITIATNNVTIDCNGFKLGGLAAGASSATNGIYAFQRVNITVRNCNVRGFNQGVFLDGPGGGHVVEDSRFDGNLYVGIHVIGDGSVIRRNLVMDTGGLTDATSSAAILGLGADIVDNTVNGVSAAGVAQYSFGVVGNGFGVLVARNSIRDIVSSNGYSTGVSASGPAATVRDNTIANPVGVSGGSPQSGIQAGNMGIPGFCIGNTVAGYSTPFAYCLATTDNQSQ